MYKWTPFQWNIGSGSFNLQIRGLMNTLVDDCCKMFIVRFKSREIYSQLRSPAVTIAVFARVTNAASTSKTLNILAEM